MLGLLARGLMSACFPTSGIQASTDFGVGFNLALDYGVASVYFENGTAVDIAKIEGGPFYKAAMRANDSIIEMANHKNFLESGRTYAKQSLLGGHLSLPSWLGGDSNSNNARSRAVSLMLKALKASTESYLESKISDAGIVIPFPPSPNCLHDLRRAAASVSLHTSMSSEPLTGVVAARAHGMDGECDYWVHGDNFRSYPEQLILTIDYSRAALTVLLLHEECGVFEYRRVIHHTLLGLDGLHRLTGEASATDLLETALRNITHLPLEDGNGAGLTHINNLVIIGEAASDHRLHDAVRRALSEQFTKFDAKTSKSGLSPPIDPVFAASRGVAWGSWALLNRSQDEGRPIEGVNPQGELSASSLGE